MAVATAHQLNSIVFDTAAVASGTPTTLGGIQQLSVNTGTQVVKEIASGSTYPELAYVNAASPTAAFSTVHIGDALNYLGLRGICIVKATGNAGLLMWARKLACVGPSAAGSSVHQMYTWQNGICVPQSLSCQHQGNAILSAQVFGIEDQANSYPPLLVTPSSAITADDTPSVTRYTLTYTVVAGVAIAQKQNVTIDFGNQPLIESADSDVLPTFASILQTSPRITIRGTDVVNWAAAVGLDATPAYEGVLCTHADTAIYLRVRGQALTNNAVHLKVTAYGLAHQETVFDANGTATGQTDLVIECCEDSTNNAPLVFDLTSNVP